MDKAAINTLTSDTALVQAVLSLFDKTPKKQDAILQDYKDLNLRKINTPQTRIGLHDQLTILGRASEYIGPDWVWEIARQNALSEAMRSAPTLGEGFDVVAKYAHIWSPAIYAESFVDREYKSLTLDVVNLGDLEDDPRKGLQFLLEFSLAAVYQELDETLTGTWQKAKILIAKPKQHRSGSNGPFANQISYDQRRYAVMLPPPLYAKSSAKADPIKFRRATLAIQNLVNPPAPNRALEEQVTAYIRATQFHRPSASEVAKNMGMSTRTLNRRLENSGSSFRLLLEQSLKSRAKALIAQGQLSRGEISERLGYKDQASFSRALRRWKPD